MLSIQVVTSLLRDQRMREQAHVIQQEVALLMEDVGRLDDRVKKLQMHFGQANKDVEDILISTRKITGRGERIDQVEFNGTGTVPETTKAVVKPAVARQAPRPVNGPPELPFSHFEER